MKRILFLLCLTGLLAGQANARARSYGYCMQGGTSFNVSGLQANPLGQGSYPGCQVDVYFTGTTTHAPIFSDNFGTVKSNPFTADTTTGLWFWYADNNRYDVKLSNGTPTPGLGAGFTLGDIVLVDTATLGFSTYFSAPFSSTPVFNLTNGTIQAMVLTGNVTSSSTLNQFAGSRLTLVFCQDGVGGRTAVFPPNFLDVFTIAPGPNQCSEGEWYFNGVSWKLFGNPMVGTPFSTFSANTWSALQTFTAGLAANSVTLTGAAVGGCLQTGAAGIITVLGSGCALAGGSVTSVGLVLPIQYNCNGSPVTSAGTINCPWAIVPTNYVLGGPTLNSIGGIFDGVAATIGNSTTPTASVTPTTNHDLAFTVFQTSGQAGLPTMPGGWISTTSNGNNAAIFRQVFNSTATINAPVTLTTSANWAELLFILRLPAGSPTLVQSQISTGAFSTIANTFPGVTTAGNSVLAVFCAPASSNIASVKFSDGQLNNYTQMGFVQNPTASVCAAALTANIAGGTTDPVTVVSTNTSGNSLFFTVELSNIATATGEPIFEPIFTSMLPPISLTSTGSGGVTSSGTTSGHIATFASNNGPLQDGGVLPTTPVAIQVFSATTLGGDVAVSATTQTTVMTRTVTMPSSGCPCRAFMSYSLYVNTGSSGVGYSFWINDGGTNMAGLNTGQSNGSAGALTSASYAGWSTVTYSNNAAVTFTLLTEGDHTYTVKAGTQLAGSAPNSSFQVAISTSN